jgi:hypothetical protein
MTETNHRYRILTGGLGLFYRNITSRHNVIVDDNEKGIEMILENHEAVQFITEYENLCKIASDDHEIANTQLVTFMDGWFKTAKEKDEERKRLRDQETADAMALYQYLAERESQKK